MEPRSLGKQLKHFVCVYYCRIVLAETKNSIIKLCAGGEGDSEGHVL